jgi:PilZ domain
MDERKELRGGRRIPCRLEAICETIEGTPPALICCPATVMDLSIAGVSLVISRQFLEGTMLFLKLPDPTATFWCGRSARVIHTKKLSTNVLIGCEFTAPLTDGELHILLGRQPAPDRRMQPRFVPSPETLGHLVVKLVDDDLPVILHDISVAGICLEADQPFPAGVPLRVELTNTVTGTHCVLWFRLLHVRKVEANWTLGGAFLEKMANQVLLTLLS